MAIQDDLVVATEENNDLWFIDKAKDVAWDAIDFVQEKWWQAIDFLQDKGWEALDVAQEFVWDIKESLFKQDTKVELEQSDVISEQWIKNSKLIDSTTVWDSFRDMFKWVKSSYDPTVDKDIKDLATFNKMQELRKVYNDSLQWVTKEYNETVKTINATDKPTKEILAEKLRLESLMTSMEYEYTLSENELISIAIKWEDEKTKRDKLDYINNQLDTGWTAYNEWQVELRNSIEADSYVNWIIRDKSTDLTWTWITWKNIESIRWVLSGQLANTKTNRERTMEAAVDSWMDQAWVEELVKKYNEFEALQEDYIEATFSWVYAWLTWDELVNSVATTMWDQKVFNMLELEWNLVPDQLLTTWKSNFFWNHKFVWSLQLISWFTTKWMQAVKDFKNDKLGRDNEDLLRREATELMTFTQSWLRKWLTWTLYNIDDLFLNTAWILATSALPAWPAALGWKLAWRVITASPRTLALYKKYNAYVKQSKLATFLMKNKYLWAWNLITNVTTWLVPNILIDTAAKDTTSEARILFGMMNDVMFWPAFDAIIWGWARVFTKWVKTFGWIAESTIVKNIADQFDMPTKEAEELFKTLDTWRTVTWIDLPTEGEQIKFVKSILDDLVQAEGWVIDRKWIITKFKEDALSITKLDKWLSEIVTNKVKLKDLDLSLNSVESIQAERLFKPFETADYQTRDWFISDVLSNLWVPKVDITRNKAETLEVSSSLYDLAKSITEQIKWVKDTWTLTADNISLLTDITRYNKLVDVLASKYNKVKQTVELYLKDWEKVTMDVTDLKTKWVRIRDKEDNALFRTTSIHNKLKNLEYEGIPDSVAKFIRFRGGNLWAKLTAENLSDTVYWINRITWVKPSIINKWSVSKFEWLIWIYQDIETWLYKIYVWGKYLKNMDFNHKLSVEIELSWADFIAEQQRIKKINDKKSKFETKEKLIKQDDKPVTPTVANSWTFTLTQSEVPKVDIKVAEETKKVTTNKVELSREEIQEGEINKAIWNRIMLSNKEFTADEFDRMVASEAINLKKVISTKDNVLRNAITLKDIAELKSYVSTKMITHLTPAFNQRELNQFMWLLDETVWSNEWLNLLSRFSRSIDEKTNKADTLWNLMESLALHSAYRFKSLDLSWDIIEALSKYWNKIKAKWAIIDLLLWAHPINALSLVWIKKWAKNIVKKIQDLTWVKIDNPILKSADKDLSKFLDSLIQSKIIKWEVSDEFLSTYKKRVTDTLLTRVIWARDAYLGWIMRQVYEWADSVDSLMTVLKNNSIEWLDELQLTHANEFEELILDATSYDQIKWILQERKDIKITESIRRNIQEKLNQYNEKDIEDIDTTIWAWVEANKKIEESYEEVTARLIKSPDENKVFEEEGFYIWDNIVTKSLNHILNPSSKAEIFEDWIAKELSNLMDKNILWNKYEEWFFEVNKKLRDENITTNDLIKYEDKLEKLQEDLFKFINPVKSEWKKLTSELIWEIEGWLAVRNTALKKIFKWIKAHVAKWHELYKVVDKAWDYLNPKQITDSIFSDRAKLGSYEKILNTLQNRVKLKPFQWLKINLEWNSIKRFSWLEEDKTLFSKLLSKEISDGKLNFTPIIVDGWSKLHRFIWKLRENNIEANNLFKYLKDNWQDWNGKLLTRLKTLIEKDLKKKWIDETASLEQIGTAFWFSEDSYLLTLNIWDKDWLWIWYNTDKWYAKWLWYDELNTKVTEDFSKRFKSVYKFQWKDLKPNVIGKRISVLTHEDTSMTPWINVKTFDYIVEELNVIETFLKWNRTDWINPFSDIEEKTIRKILAIEKPTVPQQWELVAIYEWNLEINDTSIVDLYSKTPEDIVKAKYKYLTTANTDGVSMQHNTMNKLMAQYQWYVHKNAPVKYHYAELGKDLNKTLWVPYSKITEDSLSKALFTNWVNSKWYAIDATRLVWIESKKLGKWIYEKFTWTLPEFIDETWVKRKILGWREVQSKYNRPASEEHYIQWIDVTWVTKQVTAQSHAVAKKLTSAYELNEIAKVQKELTDTFNLSKDLPISTRWEYNKFLNNIKNEVEIDNLWDTQRQYAKKRIMKLLSFFEKPKEDFLWYRWKMLPRATYITEDWVSKITKNDEVYVSKARYLDIVNTSWTIAVNKIRDGKEVLDHYVMTYRSPVANFENVTMHRLVIDKSMMSDWVSAVSPFTANVLKQADFDWDTLNMVYIKPWVHSGWISSALSFILKNDKAIDMDITDITKTIYDSSISYEIKEAKAMEFIEEFIRNNNDITMPSVAVAQVDAWDLKKILEDLPDWAALIKANTDAIVWKDWISLVSSATRTYTWLRDMAWEFKNSNITWVWDTELAELLSLTEGSKELIEIKWMINRMDLTNRDYSVDSASLNQQTVDAAKVWNMPEGWETTLREVALWTNGSKDLDKYLTSLATSYNSVYDWSNIYNYFRTYDFDTKKLVPIKKYSKNNYWEKTIFWNNTNLKNSIVDLATILDSDLAKWKKSYDEWYRQIEWVDVPDQLWLVEITKSALPKEDAWLADLVIYGHTPYKLDKVKIKRTEAGLPLSVEGWFTWAWMYKKWAYFQKKYEWKPEIFPNMSERELRDMWVTFKWGEVTYRQDEYYYSDTYLNTIEPNFKGYSWKDKWIGITISLPENRKKADWLIDLLTSKLNNKGWYLKKLSDEWAELSREEMSKDNLIKMLHAAKGSKLKDEYFKWIISGHMFPSKVVNRETNAALINSSMVQQKEFLEENLNSPKVNEQIREQFWDILDSLWNFGRIESLKLSDNNLVVTTTSTDIVPIKIDLDGKLYDIGVVDNKVYITDETNKNLLENNITIREGVNIVNEFKVAPLEADDALIKELWVNTVDVRDKEVILDKYLDDVFSTATLVNSKIAWRYFKKELLRNEYISFGIKPWTYDKLDILRRKYETSWLDNWVSRAIDNLIYYWRNWDIDPDSYKKFTSAAELDYIKDMQMFYDTYLASHVNTKKINIPRGYMNGSIIEDLVWLEIWRTEKIAFLEQWIFKLEWEKGFNAYAKKRMWKDFKDWTLSTYHKVLQAAGLEEKGEVYSRIVNDLYGWIFEVNPLKKIWWGKLSMIRNMAYQTVYGWLSWFTHLGWAIIWVSQIPVEFLRIQSLSSNLPVFAKHAELDALVNKYWILNNVWIETALRVWPIEINAPVVQKWIYNILDNLWAIFWANKHEKYLYLMRRAAAFAGNPMVITDLVLDASRKRGAISDTIFLLWFDSVDSFSKHLDSLDVFSRDSLLAKVRLQAKMTYTDISGWVTAGSYLYRDSYLSRRLMPFNFLMGWGNRVASSALEDAGLFAKWMKKAIYGDIKWGFDLMFNKSKAMQKFVESTIMTTWLYVKMYSTDDYHGEFEKRKSITDFIAWMNANFIAIWMTFPHQVIKAWIEWTSSIETRVANMINEVMINTFRELDIVELLTENIVDRVKWDRDSIFDSIMEAISAKAGKWLLYNKMIWASTLYWEFRERDDIATMLSLWVESSDEKLYYKLYAEWKDKLLEWFAESGNHVRVLLEAIKSTPFLNLLLRNTDFASYDVYEKEQKAFLDHIHSREFNDLFTNIDWAIWKIKEAWYIDDLYKSMLSYTYPAGLDSATKAMYKSSIQNLTEDMVVDRLRARHWNEYEAIVYGQADWGYEYMYDAMTENQAQINQLMMKIESDSPAAAPYILWQILKQNLYTFEKANDDARWISWIADSTTKEELDVFKAVQLKFYEPLLRASAATEWQLAWYLAISTSPKFIDTILTGSEYIKDTVWDRLMTEIAVARSIERWEINTWYLTTRMATIANKFKRALAEWDIDETVYKSKMLDFFNTILDKTNNAWITADQKLEMKTAALKSLGEDANILYEDPLLNAGFEWARVNLMHKLFDTIIDLKPLAEQAKVDLALSTGRITAGQKWFIKSSSAYKPWFAKQMWGMIPQMRSMLTNPKNGFSKSFKPWMSWYNPNTVIRPLMISKSKRPMWVEEFRKHLMEQRSLGLIRATKKYKAPDKYVKVARAESIKVEKEPYLKPIFVQRTKWLLSSLPYNRK